MAILPLVGMAVLLFFGLCFSGTFAFAYGMAWFLPLFFASSEESKKRRESGEVFWIFDLLLIIFDCIPVFWITGTLTDTQREARKLWHREKSIRSSFYTFVGCLTTSGVLIVLLFWMES